MNLFSVEEPWGGSDTPRFYAPHPLVISPTRPAYLAQALPNTFCVPPFHLYPHI